MMDPQYYSSTPPTDGLSRLVRLASLALFVIAIILLFLTFATGKVTFKVPSHSIVYVNGHRVNASSVSLKPGGYTIRVVSPRYETYDGGHRAYLWPTTYKPALRQRSPDAILSSVIGANGQYGKPGLSDAKWFEDNTWLVGEVGPGNGTPIALRFDTRGWGVGYYPVGSYPQSLNAIPFDIATYIQNLEIKYAN
jgi:hypothetical protein